MYAFKLHTLHWYNLSKLECFSHYTALLSEFHYYMQRKCVDLLMTMTPRCYIILFHDNVISLC